ncbi:hypothetical protein JHK87_006883 [Glycine soja]|nr:hypothetical protein JHK87_006883 [Glycine soja]
MLCNPRTFLVVERLIVFLELENLTQTQIWCFGGPSWGRWKILITEIVAAGARPLQNVVFVDGNKYLGLVTNQGTSPKVVYGKKMGSMGSMTSLDKVVNTLQGSPQQRPTKCGLEEETIIHPLRDCSSAKNLWIGLNMYGWFQLTQDSGNHPIHVRWSPLAENCIKLNTNGSSLVVILVFCDLEGFFVILVDIGLLGIMDFVAIQLMFMHINVYFWLGILVALTLFL